MSTLIGQGPLGLTLLRTKQDLLSTDSAGSGAERTGNNKGRHSPVFMSMVCAFVLLSRQVTHQVWLSVGACACARKCEEGDLESIAVKIISV